MLTSSPRIREKPGGGGGTGTVTSIGGLNSILATPNPITGAGTLQLVNDVATPNNGEFYGFSGGNRGWFVPSVALPSLATNHIYVGNLLNLPVDAGASLTYDPLTTHLHHIIAAGNNAFETHTVNDDSTYFANYVNTSVGTTASILNRFSNSTGLILQIGALSSTNGLGANRSIIDSFGGPLFIGSRAGDVMIGFDNVVDASAIARYFRATKHFVFNPAGGPTDSTFQFDLNSTFRNRAISGGDNTLVQFEGNKITSIVKTTIGLINTGTYFEGNSGALDTWNIGTFDSNVSPTASAIQGTFNEATNATSLFIQNGPASTARWFWPTAGYVAGGALTDVAGNGVLTWVVPAGGGITYGGPVTAGHNNEYLYIDASGDLASDPGSTRIPGTSDIRAITSAGVTATTTLDGVQILNELTDGAAFDNQISIESGRILLDFMTAAGHSSHTMNALSNVLFFADASSSTEIEMVDTSIEATFTGTLNQLAKVSLGGPIGPGTAFVKLEAHSQNGALNATFNVDTSFIGYDYNGQPVLFPLSYVDPTDNGKTMILNSATGQLSWGFQSVTAMAIGDPVTGGTDPSVLFIQGGNLAEDPTHFAYVPSTSFLVNITDTTTFNSFLNILTTGSTYIWSDVTNGTEASFKFIPAGGFVAAKIESTDSTTYNSYTNIDNNSWVSAFFDVTGSKNTTITLGGNGGSMAWGDGTQTSTSGVGASGSSMTTTDGGSTYLATVAAAPLGVNVGYTDITNSVTATTDWTANQIQSVFTDTGASYSAVQNLSSTSAVLAFTDVTNNILAQVNVSTASSILSWADITNFLLSGFSANVSGSLMTANDNSTGVYSEVVLTPITHLVHSISATNIESGLSGTPTVVTVGNLGGGNLNQLAIDDTSNTVILSGTYNSVASQYLFAQWTSAGTQGQIAFGDLSGSLNSTQQLIDDVNQLVQIQSGGAFYFQLDVPADVYHFNDGIPGDAGVYLYGPGYAGAYVGAYGAVIDVANQVLTFGDAAASHLEVDVGGAYFNFRGNTTLTHFDFMPAYDDDAAAGVGGLVTGDLFQTTGGGAITTAGVMCIKQ